MAPASTIPAAAVAWAAAPVNGTVDVGTGRPVLPTEPAVVETTSTVEVGAAWVE